VENKDDTVTIRALPTGNAVGNRDIADVTSVPKLHAHAIIGKY
jgi:hypothetical protein